MLRGGEGKGRGGRNEQSRRKRKVFFESPPVAPGRREKGEMSSHPNGFLGGILQ